MEELAREKAVGATSLADLVQQAGRATRDLDDGAGGVVDKTIAELLPLLEPGDILIDGGNSYYRDDIRRAKELAARQIHYVDCGTSGGVWGLERGYCLMIGGDDRGGAAPRPDLRDAGARRQATSAHRRA